MAGGEIYCSHVATWVALRDVPDDTGFAVVPGSHRSAFALPDFLLPATDFEAAVAIDETIILLRPSLHHY